MSFNLIIFLLWCLLAAGLGVVWIVRLIAVRAATKRRVLLGSQSYDGAPSPAPKVSIVVAAKDEEGNIEACVRSLLDQDYSDFELIVVDDRSRDRTPDILRRLQREAGERMRVITISHLRDGWFGKNNAMREGVAASAGEWLLFTDADCRQTSRRTLSMAMREAATHRADFLSVTPLLEAPTFWERIIQPVCALVLILWFLPEKVNDPAKRTAYANGAFMLMRRDCYDAIGGHERVRTELNEDIQLARLTKREGFTLRVVENKDLYTTRMYPTPIAAWRGWSRIFYGSLQSIRRLMIAAALLLLFSITPWMSMIVAAVGLFQSTPENSAAWLTTLMLWSGVVLTLQVVTWRLYEVFRTPPIWSLTYFPGTLVVLTMLVNAMFKVVGATSTTWRGTAYRKDRLEHAHAAAPGHDGAREFVPVPAQGSTPDSDSAVEMANKPTTGG